MAVPRYRRGRGARHGRGSRELGVGGENKSRLRIIFQPSRSRWFETGVKQRDGMRWRWYSRAAAPRAICLLGPGDMQRAVSGMALPK